MQKTCLIIPCYNEEERLDINTFMSYLATTPHILYFVNDGSTDGTLRLLEKLKNRFPDKIDIINLKNNSGKGEAVRQGVLGALPKDCIYIGYLDADLATPLEEIDYLLTYFQDDFKIVIGSRVKRLGANIHRNLFRHYLGRVFATFASIYLNIKVYDSQCGAKIFKKDVAEKLFSEPFVTNWLFDLELIFRCKFENPDFKKEIIEVPLRTWQEKKNSKIKLIDFFTAPLELLKIKNTAIKSQKP